MKDYDPIVDPVREARHRISERFGHDPKRLVEHYMQLDEEDSGQLVGNKRASEEEHGEGGRVRAGEQAS